MVLMHPPSPPRLPGQCAVCRRWTRGRVCGACVQRFAPSAHRCVQCGLRTPAPHARCGACLRRAQPPVDSAIAAVDYGFPWDGLIAGFKFHQRLDLADALARLLGTALAQAPAPATRPSLIVPVPLAAERLRERGYNQAWEIARRVARWCRIEARPDVLLRVKNTAHQLGLSEAERAANLRGAFLVEPRQRARLQGQVVALVDDVATSGATADEAAKALKAAGAAQVQLWVVARTP
jgi:ComF family protein